MHGGFIERSAEVSENTFAQYRSETLPDDPGVYAFRASIVSFEHIGLRGRGHSTGAINRAKQKLVARLGFFDEIFAGRVLNGSLVEENNPATIGVCYDATLSQSQSLDLSRISERVEAIDDFQKLVQLLNMLTLALPPLYIGITVDQTLKQRYRQHRRDFETKRQGCFGGRVAAVGLAWDDLDFSAITLPTGLAERQIVEFAESMLHAFTKPLFSTA